jgi:hypothetical protein
VTLTGQAFPPNTEVSLVWKSFDGRFVLEQEEVVYVGPRYEERLIEMERVRTDASGALRARLTIPEDFGGMHDISARIDGKFATKTGYFVTPSFSVSTTSGPVGTPVEIRATGLGYRYQESMWEVSWNNGFTGYMTAVNTKGTGTARVRLAGPPGKHVLKIWRTFRGIPYLNPHQGPFGALPEPTTFVMDVTEGTYNAPALWTDPKPEDTVRAAPQAMSQGGGRLSVTPDKGEVGSKITIRGEGFPAGQPIKLTWSTRTGQRLTTTGLLEGFEEKLRDLPAVTSGSDGRFTQEMVIWDDFAGLHRITATSGNVLGEAYYSIYASIPEFTHTARVGENIRINMKGVGWTIQGKTYAVV